MDRGLGHFIKVACISGHVLVTYFLIILKRISPPLVLLLNFFRFEILSRINLLFFVEIVVVVFIFLIIKDKNRLVL